MRDDLPLPTSRDMTDQSSNGEGMVMAHIDRAYLALALVLLLLGDLLGFYMGISNDTKLRGVHIGMVLNGFANLAIYGFIFRLWPAMKSGPLAAAQFWLGALGAIGLMIGMYLQSVGGGGAIIAPSAVVAIVAAAILLWLFCMRRDVAA